MKQYLKFTDAISSARDSSADDDLYICASSFEPRCVGGVAHLPSKYKARATILINFTSRSSGDGEARRRRHNELLLSWLSKHDQGGDPIFLTVAPYDPSDLWSQVQRALARRGVATPKRVTLDVSCLPKIQFAFVLRALTMDWECRARLLYALPASYTSDDGYVPTSYGYQRPRILPFELQPSHSRTGFRVAIVLLGHEGDRTLHVWRELDVDRTILFLPKSAGHGRMAAAARTWNRFLLSEAAREGSLFKVFEIDSFDAESARNHVSDTIQGWTNAGIKSTYIIPFGPKPLLLGVLAWGLDWDGQVNLAYADPKGYRGDYSLGISGVFQCPWTHTPPKDSPEGRPNQSLLDFFD